MLTSMARLPLNTLPAFAVVARLSNLRAAAEQLHLTHSALSQQIKLLEQQLGFALFDRRGRRLVLNAAGAALLRGVEPALAQLEAARVDAATAAARTEPYIRLTVTPSFAQRWLLPRMGRWHARHPGRGIDLHTSQEPVDLTREGFHAALRQGHGPWHGLEAEPLIDSPRILVGSRAAAERLRGRGPAALTTEPLLGNVATWERWFALAGLKARVHPVAAFNDAGLMLQAVEQDLGLALVRGLLVADALRQGTLVRLAPLALPGQASDTYSLAYPPAQRDTAALHALRDWLHEELARSAGELAAAGSLLNLPAGTASAGPTGSRSRAASATRARSRAR